MTLSLQARSMMDQVKAMTRDEMQNVAAHTGVNNWAVAEMLLETSDDLAKTGECTLKPGVVKMIGLLAFIGITTLMEEQVDDDDA